MEKVASQIVDWIKNYAQQARIKGLVIDISGGINSVATSTLCARTGSSALCLEMPTHQIKNYISRVEGHINFLRAHYPNVTNLRVDLIPVFDQFIVQVPLIDKPIYGITLTNTRARLRMMTLYHFAGLKGYTVVSTGNRTGDSDVGFFIKYGGEGVDISPIADLMKGGVYKLGEYLRVPRSILKAKPSDGLFGNDRSDEDQLKATYDELGWAMLQTEQG